MSQWSTKFLFLLPVNQLWTVDRIQNKKDDTRSLKKKIIRHMQPLRCLSLATQKWILLTIIFFIGWQHYFWLQLASSFNIGGGIFFYNFFFHSFILYQRTMSPCLCHFLWLTGHCFFSGAAAPTTSWVWK